jgi:hypothetical protein
VVAVAAVVDVETLAGVAGATELAPAPAANVVLLWPAQDAPRIASSTAALATRRVNMA